MVGFSSYGWQRRLTSEHRPRVIPSGKGTQRPVPYRGASQLFRKEGVMPIILYIALLLAG